MCVARSYLVSAIPDKTVGSCLSRTGLVRTGPGIFTVGGGGGRTSTCDWLAGGTFSEASACPDFDGSGFVMTGG